jgi:CheY-like chemotaxis protein
MSNQQTVLIVEDDPVFRRVLSFTVARAGFKSATASNGERGFERLMQGDIDFLVTDLQMPVCCGLQLLERLAALEDFTRPQTILCTAKGLELDTEELKNRFGLLAIMHKPFSPRKLSDLIVKHMPAAGQADCPPPRPALIGTALTPAARAAAEVHGHE